MVMLSKMAFGRRSSKGSSTHFHFGKALDEEFEVGLKTISVRQTLGSRNGILTLREKSLAGQHLIRRGEMLCTCLPTQTILNPETKQVAKIESAMPRLIPLSMHWRARLSLSHLLS